MAKKSAKKAVILLSGGLDSAVTLYYAKNKGYGLTALLFDYNQRNKRELDCARKICLINKINFYLEKISLSWAKSSLTDRDIRVPLLRDLNKKEIPATYVSGRNIIFLSYAFSLAESIGAEKVFIGAHIADYSGYPDCRPAFLRQFNTAVNKGMEKTGIKICAPLINKDKKDIVKLGLKLAVPFQHTRSCYNSGAKPCLKCDSCRFRAKAFECLGIKDPA